MTVESNYATAALSDWLKTLAQVFQPMTSKTKTNRALYLRCFPRFEQVTGNGRNSDWFMALFAPAVIGQSSNYSGIGFSTVI